MKGPESVNRCLKQCVEIPVWIAYAPGPFSPVDPVFDGGEKMILIAKVRHSQSVTATPLHPWIAAKRSGMILFSQCTCMAGLGEACSNVAM